MKKIFIIIALCIGTISLYAQQDVNHILYTQNPFLINPAVVGLDNKLDVFLNHRDQGIGFDGAPRSLTFGAAGALGENVGLGGLVMSDQRGVFENQQASLAYSYKIDVMKEQSVSFGFSGGVQKFHVKSSALQVQDASDLNLNSEYYDKTSFFVGFGMHYQIADLGLDIAAPKLYDGDSKEMLQLATLGLTYNIFAKNNDLMIQPSIYTKMEKNNPAIVDFNVLTIWKQMVWLQLGFRTTSGIIAGAGVNYKGVGIGYAYERNMGVLSELAGGSHEVMISYRLGKI